MKQSILNLLVGLFVIVSTTVLFYIAFNASSVHGAVSVDVYELKASFDDIGSLMVRAPVRIAGVKVGEVAGLDLDSTNFKAVVKLAIYSKNNNIPKDSSISIMTEGLLGAKYLSISPGFSLDVLKSGDYFENTHSAFILENLIGKFLFKT